MTLSLSAHNIVKRYGGVVALSDANLEVHSGEVLALIGANGSGKSTLSKIINGVVVLDGGQLLLDGQPAHFASPQAARSRGISTVFQELSLVPQMTVAENIWLTREPRRRGGIVDHQREYVGRPRRLLALFEGTFKSKLTPDMPVTALSPDEKQIVEILKAVSSDPRLLILDEATASLDSRQVQRLFELVTDLEAKRQSDSVRFPPHGGRFSRIADRYSVLRNGKTVGEGLIKDATTKSLVDLMVQEAAVQNVVQRIRPTAAELAGAQSHARSQGPASHSLARSELPTARRRAAGAGRPEGAGPVPVVARPVRRHALLRHHTRHDAPARFNHPRQAMQRGLALVPGERAREGLLLIRSILENFQIPSWRDYGFPLRMGKARKDASDMANVLTLKMAGMDAPVSSLSGGNAQKVVIGKWLLRKPHLLMLDDPTKGMDVSAKADFYKLLAQLCDEGKSVLLYSSDDEELIGLCDRVLVMHDGRIKSELSRCVPH